MGASGAEMLGSGKAARDDESDWDDEDDYWKGAEKDVARDADGHLVVSEEGKRIDARAYKWGWSLVIGAGVFVALIAGVVSLALK